MNSFSAGIEDLLRSDHSLLEKPLQDFEGAALQIFVGLLVKITAVADEMDERMLVELHGITSLAWGKKSYDSILAYENTSCLGKAPLHFVPSVLLTTKTVFCILRLLRNGILTESEITNRRC
jgi:hypothetical protein